MKPNELAMADQWAGILGKDEEILWQGAPKAKVRLEFDSAFAPLFFLFFTGFSVFWMVGASAAGGYFWTFGLIFFVVGAYGLVGVHFWKAYLRKHQYYTLTNQRALIGTSIFGRKSLKSYPIVEATEIALEDAGIEGDVYFAEKESRGRNGTQITRIGFEQIENPRHVLSLMRQVQEGQ